MTTHINTNTLWLLLRGIKEQRAEITQWALIAAFALVQLFPANLLRYSAPFMQPRVFRAPLHTILLTNRSPASYVFKPGTVLGVTATAYSPTVQETDSDPFTTASGQRVDPSIIAANFLPLGTRVQIGPRVYEVGDRMNSRYNDEYRIDLLRPTPEEARAFGVRQLTLDIVSLP